MRKKIFMGIFALALLATAGYGVQKSMKSNVNLSGLALSNVEALADGENGGSAGQTWQVSSMVETIEIYKTTTPGYTWNIGGNVWFLNGQRTKTWPSQYTKATTSITSKCCRLMGDQTSCVYEICPTAPIS